MPFPESDQSDNHSSFENNPLHSEQSISSDIPGLDSLNSDKSDPIGSTLGYVTDNSLLLGLDTSSNDFGSSKLTDGLLVSSTNNSLLYEDINRNSLSSTGNYLLADTESERSTSSISKISTTDFTKSKVYQDLGGADGILGEPTSDSYSVGDGLVQEFTGGQISSSSSGVFPTFGGVGFQYWNYEGGPEGRLGYPTDFEAGLGNGVIVQDFEGGQILYGDGDTRTVIGNKELAIGYDGSGVNASYVDTFNRVGGWDVVGSPVNNVYLLGNGHTQDFNGGSDGNGAIMKSSADNDSYWVSGDIHREFIQASGAYGLLEYPTSDAYEIEGGQLQTFQGGSIIQSDHGTFALYGGIGKKYFDLNAERGFLGLPTSVEYPGRNGFTRQDFKGGYILWKSGYEAIPYDTSAIEALPIDSGQGSTSKWSVHYWNGTDMAGAPDWTGYADEGELRFSAGFGAPIGTWGIREDNFSSRWSTKSYFDGGIYNFSSRADDGVRVFVDGIKIIDKWSATAPFSKDDGYVLIPEGDHDVVVEYFESGGGSALHLTWEREPLSLSWSGELLPVGADGSKVHGTYTSTFERNGGAEKIGYPLNRVHVWGNGRIQDFKGGADGDGAIMKSDANDASYYVGGDTWLAYLQTDGANGILGYPISDSYSVAGGEVQDFQNGKILSSAAGTFPVFGGIGNQYLKYEGGPEGRLGYPTKAESGIGNGAKVQDFENGQILYGAGPIRTLMGGQELAVGYDGSSVHKTYTDTFDRAGGFNKVGYAINNIHVWGDGRTQDFSGGADGDGAIMKSDANDASYYVGGDTWSAYLQFDGANGILGYPTSDSYSVAGGEVQDFQNGKILSSAAGTFPVFGGIGNQYLKYEGGAAGRLGYPTKAESGIGNGAKVQDFENGQILYGAGPIRTLIGGQELAVGYDGSSVHKTYTDTFDRAGGFNKVGYAINNIHVWKNGRIQDFSGGADGDGAIMKSDANDASYYVGGDTWSAYLQADGANGILGYPTSDSYNVGDGVLRQDFQGGSIYKTRKGAFPIFGGIRNYYFERAGGELGALGFPGGKEVGIGNDVKRQSFQNGYVLWDGSATAYRWDNSLMFPVPSSGTSNSNDNFIDSDYLKALYKDGVANGFSRKTHGSTSAFDSDDSAPDGVDTDNRIYALVGGEVIEAKNGRNIKDWGYNGTVAIYNSQLNKTFLYWHLAENSIDESLEGQTITSGSMIGREGSTGLSYGDHTHVEIHEGRAYVDMSNPNAPNSPANSGRLDVGSVFQDAVRLGLVADIGRQDTEGEQKGDNASEDKGADNGGSSSGDKSRESAEKISFDENQHSITFSRKTTPAFGGGYSVSGGYKNEWPISFPGFEAGFLSVPEVELGSIEAKFDVGANAFLTSGTYDVEIPSLFDISSQEKAQPGGSVTINVDTRLLENPSFSVFTGAALGLNIGVDSSISVSNSSLRDKFPSLLKAAIPELEYKLSAQGSLSLDESNLLAMFEEGLNIGIDPNLIAENFSGFNSDNELNASDDAFQFVSADVFGSTPPTIPVQKLLSSLGAVIKMGVNIKQESKLKFKYFEVDWDGIKNGNEVLIEPGSSGKLTALLPSGIASGDVHRFELSVKPHVEVSTVYKLQPKVEGSISPGKGLIDKLGLDFDAASIPFWKNRLDLAAPLKKIANLDLSMSYSRTAFTTASQPFQLFDQFQGLHGVNVIAM